MPIKLPVYAKASLLAVGLFAFLSMLSIGQSIIIPFIFAVIFSIVLHPLVTFFIGLRLNRILAISIAMAIAFLVIAATGFFFFTQENRYGESVPLFIDRLTEILNDALTRSSQYFKISPQKIIAWMAHLKISLTDTSGAALGKTIVTVGNLPVLIFLIPVYVFMLLYFHPLLIKFPRRLSGKDNRSKVNEIISEIKLLIQQYLVGLSVEAGIIAALYTIGLTILGIPYALLPAIIGALLNLIPYIGSIIAAVLPMILAVISRPSPWSALLVLGVYSIIQFIDNNFLVPKIVASKVRINALVSIIAVIAYGALRGIPVDSDDSHFQADF